MKPSKDGYYHKYFTHDGKRYHLAAKSEAELYMAVGKMMHRLEQGELTLNRNTTVRHWAVEWLSTYKEGRMTQKSFDTYNQKLNGYILPAIGDMKLKDVRDIHLQKILNDQRGMSYSHAARVRNILEQMFSRAVSSRLITYNPAADLVLPECSKGTHRSITDQEREAILAVCPQHPAGLWVKMILFCGLRPGETIALQWRDVDFEKGLIHVHAAKESGRDHIKEPKTAAGVRDVPVRTDYLAELRAVQRGPFEPVFHQQQTANQRKPHTESSMRTAWRSFKRLVDIEMAERQLSSIAAERNARKAKLLAGQLHAEIPAAEILRRIKAGNLRATQRNLVVIHGEAPELLASLQPYCLRHTYCTDLQRAGVPLNVAKHLMGHSDISVTANIYTHVTEDVIQEAAEKIEALAAR